MKASLDALGGVSCPFASLSHTGSAKPGMKGLDLLYFCQVNKSCCFGCSLHFNLSLKHRAVQLCSRAKRHYCSPNSWKLRSWRIDAALLFEGTAKEGKDVWGHNCVSQLHMNRASADLFNQTTNLLIIFEISTSVSSVVNDADVLLQP